MATPSAYEFLKNLMDVRNTSMIDGTIKAVNGALVDVKVAGSSTVLTGVPLSEHVYTDRLIPGAPCSLALHQTQPFVIAIHLPPSSDDITVAGTAAIGGGNIPQPSLSGYYDESDGYVYLTWVMPQSQKYKYDVFANDSDDGLTITHLTRTGFGVVTYRYSGTLDWFAVKAINAAGQDGPLSAWIQVHGPFKELPLAPEFTVEYRSAFVEFNISKNVSGGATPTKWRIYKATASDGTGKTLVDDYDWDPDEDGETWVQEVISDRDTYTWYTIVGIVEDQVTGTPDTWLEGAYPSYEQDTLVDTPPDTGTYDSYRLTPDGWLVSWHYLVGPGGQDKQDWTEFVEIYTHYEGGA